MKKCKKKMFFVFLAFYCIYLLTACNGFIAQHKDFTSSNLTSSNANVELGLAYLKSGWKPEAKSKLLLALHRDPKNSLAYGAFGYFLEQSGEAKMAEKYYLRAIETAKAEDKGASFNNYGTYLYRNKRYQEAIKYFLQAVKEPTYLGVSHAYENAGLAALKLSDAKMAKVYFQKALEHGGYPKY